MKNRYTRILVAVLVLAGVSYSGYLYKKAFIDKGYGSEEAEKEIYLSYYVLHLGLEDTPQNRNKYRFMSLEQIKKALGE